MSFNKKLKEIALYIGSEYPDLDLNSISSSHMCVVDICKNIFKKTKDNKLKRNIVYHLKNENSTLRKLLINPEILNNSNNSLIFENESINSCKLGVTLQKYNYTSIHFKHFNRITLDDICKKLT